MAELILAALVAGRARVSCAEMGHPRLIAGLVLYALFAHETIIGVTPFRV